MTTPEPMNDDQFQALKLILSMSDSDQETLFRGIPSVQLNTVHTALQGLQELLRAVNTKTYLGTFYATLSPAQRRQMLTNFSPAQRVELLRQLDHLGAHQQVLDVAMILASAETLLLDGLET